MSELPNAADGGKPLPMHQVHSLLPPSPVPTVTDEAYALTVRKLAETLDELQRSKSVKPDHLELARRVVDSIGHENLLFADHTFWLWVAGYGVWRATDDKAIKQAIQKVLEACRVPVNANTVNSVADVLRNLAFKQDHAFNIGPVDVVNCLTGELELSPAGWTCHPHRREHYRTNQIPVRYDPTAHAPQFTQFMHDIFRDDPDRTEKIQAVMELIGYTLMSHANHERFVMLIGSGGNGKSVLLRVIESLLGQKNVAAVQPSQFNNKFQRANLHNKMANIVTELRQGEIIADAELKAITSGELTTVENKGQNPFEMRAFSTCWFGTNHLPHTRDFSDALFRRATIIQFNRSFSEAEQDRNLIYKLQTELPGILNYALYYYAQAIAHGFTAPQSSVDAKRKWRIEADQVAQFVQERCVADPTREVEVGELYLRFRQWALDSGIRQIVGKQAMGDRLELQGFKRKRSNGSWIVGLRLGTTPWG